MRTELVVAEVVLVDEQRPGDVDGQLVRLAKERKWCGLTERLLVATADVRPSTEEALQRLGLRYLRKPFNLRLLRDEAARVWASPATLS